MFFRTELASLSELRSAYMTSAPVPPADGQNVTKCIYFFAFLLFSIIKSLTLGNVTIKKKYSSKYINTSDESPIL